MVSHTGPAFDGFTNAITRDHADSTVLPVAAPNVHSRQRFMP